jgi:hypothetical protein
LIADCKEFFLPSVHLLCCTGGAIARKVADENALAKKFPAQFFGFNVRIYFGVMNKQIENRAAHQCAYCQAEPGASVTGLNSFILLVCPEQKFSAGAPLLHA